MSERICIVDRNGCIVRLNDKRRTVCRFMAHERPRAERICESLNTYRPQSLGAPFRIIDLIGEPRVVALGVNIRDTSTSPDLPGSIDAEQERFGVHPADVQHARHLRHVMEAEGDH
jgi:hypothetical protein